MPISSISILGRQPKLGLAELEAVFGPDNVRAIGSTAAGIDGKIQIKRFGGQMKTGAVLATLDTTDFNKLIDHVRKILPQLARDTPEGKIKLGLSFYDFNISPAKINAAALSLKKTVKSAGRSVRIAPNTDPALSTAQTVHNQLTSPVGIEFLFIRDGNKTVLAQASEVQNLVDYTRRDRERPKRDTFVGMLPPKLAQIMINLSGAQEFGTLWDPFCGTGVILQEALLMGIDVYGSDISERMIDYSRQNIEWLEKKYSLLHEGDKDMWYDLRVGDATTIQFENKHSALTAIACEGYLGQPMSQEPTREKLESIMHECNVTMRGFLKNVAPQLAPGTRLCIGAPAWHISGTFRHLPVIDTLKELGFSRVEFDHASLDDLIYYREDQIVGRELIVLLKD